MTNLILNPKRGFLEEESLKEGASKIRTGALSVTTGKCTGRSPKAKFIVRDDITENLVDWTNNTACSREDFDDIKGKILSALSQKKTNYVQQVYAGHDSKCRIKVEATTSLAWQSIFVKNMFIEPSSKDLQDFGEPDWKIFACPSAFEDPRVVVSFKEKEIYIAGTYYAGEIKKSIFTILNFVLPQTGVLPMHCSVNESIEGGNSAVFFGLSGTGKTTLSADTSRSLIGDDEHGWSDTGLFNFEGGCYAKVINLSKDAEPQIWEACQAPGAILENVVVVDGEPDFSDARYTENTRGSYDLSHISNVSRTGVTSHPSNVIFLTCDAFGVLPPVAKLSAEEAAEHFILGYTAKVAGTESGVTEPEATFSHCFGAPFMPLHPEKYAEILREKIQKHNVDCWLVNTGWTGGAYGIGRRMPIGVSREIVRKIIEGKLKDNKFVRHDHTRLMIPIDCAGELKKYAIPENTWDHKSDYEKHAADLMSLFDKRKKHMRKNK